MGECHAHQAHGAALLHPRSYNNSNYSESMELLLMLLLLLLLLLTIIPAASTISFPLATSCSELLLLLLLLLLLQLLLIAMLPLLILLQILKVLLLSVLLLAFVLHDRSCNLGSSVTAVTILLQKWHKDWLLTVQWRWVWPKHFTLFAVRCWNDGFLWKIWNMILFIDSWIAIEARCL